MGSRYMTMKWFASKFQMKAVFFFSESISFKMFLKILKEQKPWNRKSSLYIFWFYSARKIRINLLSLALFIAINNTASAKNFQWLKQETWAISKIFH